MREQYAVQSGAATVERSQYVCPECGMTVSAGDYHPYAACLMVEGCHEPAVIREALLAVFEDGLRAAARQCRCDGAEFAATKIEGRMRCDAE